MGSAIIQFLGQGTEDFLSCTVWIGRNSVGLMLNKEEINDFNFLLSWYEKTQ